MKVASYVARNVLPKNAYEILRGPFPRAGHIYTRTVFVYLYSFEFKFKVKFSMVFNLP